MNAAEVTLEIMGKGMGGLFVAATVMMLAITLLQRLTERWNERRQRSAVGSRGIKKNNDYV